jgi:hypothetical protein
MSNQGIDENEGLNLTTVVFLVELKRNGITRDGTEGVWLISQLAIETYDNFVVITV